MLWWIICRNPTQAGDLQWRGHGDLVRRKDSRLIQARIAKFQSLGTLSYRQHSQNHRTMIIWCWLLKKTPNQTDHNQTDQLHVMQQPKFDRKTGQPCPLVETNHYKKGNNAGSWHKVALLYKCSWRLHVRLTLLSYFQSIFNIPDSYLI